MVSSRDPIHYQGSGCTEQLNIVLIPLEPGSQRISLQLIPFPIGEYLIRTNWAGERDLNGQAKWIGVD